MKHYLYIFCSLLSLTMLGQCPSGSVILNGQEDVNNFVQNYPNCSVISGNLEILAEPGEDGIEDLSGLTNLTEVTGGLEILGENDAPTALSLTGLENLVTVEYLTIENSSESQDFHIESLSPLNGLTGSLEHFTLANLILQEELLDFDAISAAEEIYLENVRGSIQTPQFPGLVECAALTVSGGYDEENGIASVYIPENLEEFSLSENVDISGLIIANTGVSELVGGGNFLKSPHIEIRDNPNLESLSGLNQVVEADHIELRGCQSELFNIMPNLTNLKSLFVRVDPSPCENDFDNLTISLGGNTTFIDTNEVELALEVYNLDTVHFEPDFTTLKDLEILAFGTLEISGFENLVSIEGTGLGHDLVIAGYSCTALPNFANLTEVQDNLIISLGFEESPLQNLEGLNALESVDYLLIIGIESNPEFSDDFESLDGLDAIEEIDFLLFLDRLPALNNISELEDLPNSVSMSLRELPSFTVVPTFENFTFNFSFEMENVALENVPSFPNASQMSLVRLINNENLISTSNFSNIDQFFSFYAEGNPQLEEIVADDPVSVYNNLSITDNPNLVDCGSSVTICQMIQTAQNVEVSGNGSACNSQLSILDACQTLSTDRVQAEDVVIWTDGSGNLLVESPTGLYADVTVFDYQGKTILFERQVAIDGVKSFNLASTNAGIYLVSLNIRGRIITKKLFVH